MLKQILEKRRIKKYIKKWQSDINYIESEIKEFNLNKQTNRGSVFWGQLLPNEIWAYCKKNKTVGIKEINELCYRRGFDFKMKKYLIDMLKHLNLFK